MIFKFKNGYSVLVADEDIKDKDINEVKKQAIEAGKAVKKYNTKDAVNLGRNIETNILFSVDSLKEALLKQNEDRVQRELRLINRDIDTDLSDIHKNYTDRFTKETIFKVMDKYNSALKVLKDFKRPEYFELSDKIDELYKVWGDIRAEHETFNAEKAKASKEKAAATKEFKKNLPPVENTETGEILDTKVEDVPVYDPTEYATISSDEVSTERLMKTIRHASDDEVKEEDFKIEFEGLLKELDELIALGADALTKAGWTKEEGQTAIEKRYGPVLSELRSAGKKEEIKVVRDKIKELQNTWHIAKNYYVKNKRL